MRPVVGLDLSMTSTGVAWLPDSATRVRTDPGRWPDEVERLMHIRSSVIALVTEQGRNSLVVVEGLSYGSHSAGSATRAGLHYLVRASLRQLGMTEIVVPPATLKKFVTGSGAAPKSLMVSTASLALGRTVSSDDVADALGLVAFGCALLRQAGPFGPLAAHQERTIERFEAKP